MKATTIKRYGEHVQGVVFFGDPKGPEPDTFRIKLPFGEVETVRTTEGDYWVHVYVYRPGVLFPLDPGNIPGVLSDARIDKHEDHSSDELAEPEGVFSFRDPSIYHLAVRLKSDTR